jgi:hypothetical protein
MPLVEKKNIKTTKAENKNLISTSAKRQNRRLSPVVSHSAAGYLLILSLLFFIFILMPSC